jgi:Ca2+-binding EF-hand superfamily protein
VFDKIDTGDDNRVGLKEFKQAIPELEKWGIDMSDCEQRFKECDSDSKGMVLFDEFCEWAIKIGLNVDEGDEDSD